MPPNYENHSTASSTTTCPHYSTAIWSTAWSQPQTPARSVPWIPLCISNYFDDINYLLYACALLLYFSASCLVPTTLPPHPHTSTPTHILYVRRTSPHHHPNLKWTAPMQFIGAAHIFNMSSGIMCIRNSAVYYDSPALREGPKSRGRGTFLPVRNLPYEYCCTYLRVPVSQYF